MNNANHVYHVLNTHKKGHQFEDVFINEDLKSQVTLFMDYLGNKLKL